MKVWLTARYEDGDLALALRGSAVYGKPGEERTVTATLPVPQGDETAQDIKALVGDLVARFDGDLRQELAIEQARALVYARDRREV